MASREVDPELIASLDLIFQSTIRGACDTHDPSLARKLSVAARMGRKVLDLEPETPPGVVFEQIREQARNGIKP